MNLLLLSLLLLSVLYAEARGTTNTTSARPLCPAVRRCLSSLTLGKPCATLPIPSRARFEAIPAGSFKLQRLRRGVWAFLDTAYVSLILHRGGRLVVVDFPEESNADGLPLVTDAVAAILKSRAPRRIDMVYSHAHYDHIGGATRFHAWARDRFPRATVRVWGTAEARDVIRDSRTKRAPEPTRIIRARAKITLGGMELRMVVVGGHTVEDLLLHIPRRGRQQGVAMLVDFVFPRWAPFFSLALSESVTRYLEVHRVALKLPFEKFVGGHFRVSSRGDVRESLRFGESLLKAADTAVEVSPQELAETDIGRALDPRAVEFGNLWFAIRELRRVQESKCVRKMIEKWGCVIGGVDITIERTCFTAVEHRLLEV